MRERMISPELKHDILKVAQLEQQIQYDPSAAIFLIQLCEQILERLKPEQFPDIYAMIKGTLGNTYAEMLIGNRTTNLEHAIACYEEALQFWTAEAPPPVYATTRANLGTIYLQIPTGTRAVNLQRAIVHHREALRFWTPQTAPIEYAMVQHYLGCAYYQLPTGDRAANLGQAIACYQEALRYRTPEAAPLDYAATQNNLGSAYCDLPTGDREANLKRAIACYQQALRFRTPETTPLDYAMTQHNLGSAYHEFPRGDRATNLEHAIACYQEALRFWTPEDAPFDYAMTQNNLGAAYSQLPTGDRAANLTQAIACYQEVLRFWTPQNDPFNYAATKTNLGNAYCELPTGDRVANLTQAIACYQEALRYRTTEAAPFDYAMTQNNLGNAYWNLPTQNRAANLEHAIACYQEALCFWTPEGAPFLYAATQTNLGNVYLQMLTGDRTANLEHAITHYREALRFRTPEAAPFDYATTQNNLGNAYLQLPIGDRTVNLQQAMACYQQALRFRTPEAAPFDYTATQTNLGNAYAQMPTGDRTANLQHAIACYQKALQFWTPQNDSFSYATVQNNLGEAYRELPTGNRSENLQRAIACYQRALRFRTPEAAPFDYAATQLNLGNAYRYLPTGDRAANLGQAIACYQQALLFFTLDADPFRCRTTNRNLASLYFEQQEWEKARDISVSAIKAGERLYQAGLSTESKAAEIRDNATLYQMAAFSAARCGNTTEALLLLEQGKTRLLAEALRLRVSRPDRVPETVWQKYEQASAAFRAARTEERISLGVETLPQESYEQREQVMRDATAALDDAIKQVRLYAPDFLGSPDLKSMRSLLEDSHTALVAFCITEEGSMGFIMSSQAENLITAETSTFKEADLVQLFAVRDEKENLVGGWLEAYTRYLRQPNPETHQNWEETMTQALKMLGQRLLVPLLSGLPTDVRHLIFLPSAQLFLFPLHAVPLSDRDGDLVCDRYPVSYAPSLEVLFAAKARVAQTIVPDLYAVINPEVDPRLVFTQVEGQALASLFVQRQVDIGRVGTKDRVIAEIPQRSYVHFSCHGSYNWSDPPASGLVLADARLTLAELQQGQVDLSHARLVTLSACETGMSDVIHGSPQEYVGIPAGFLLAGVPCVVSSLWAVPDLSTAFLIERLYYNHVKDKMDVAAALREAQIWVRTLTIGEVVHYVEHWYEKSHGEERIELFRYLQHYRYLAKQGPALHPFVHPYYWAAFTCTGV